MRDEKLRSLKRFTPEYNAYLRSAERAQFYKENHNRKYHTWRETLFTGKSCILCNATKYLHYQHIEEHPDNKDINKMKDCSNEIIQAEIQKCYPICNACTLKFRRNQLSVEERQKIPRSQRKEQ